MTRRTRWRRGGGETSARAAWPALVLGTLAALCPAPGTAQERGKKPVTTPAEPPLPVGSIGRWTAATPDAMVDAALARAERGGDDALAGLLIAATLDERSSFGRVRAGLSRVASRGGPLAEDARWLERTLEPEPAATWAGLAKLPAVVAPADPTGLVRALAVLGPFEDTGGGLSRREGPEAEGQSFAEAGADYTWGAYRVAWRPVLSESASARGVPLDLYVSPRKETCSYVASKLEVPPLARAERRPLVLRVGATGAVRLLWDGVELASSEELHGRLVLDRMAVRVDATPGPHIVAVKVCSGALADEGRVRIRVTDVAGGALPLVSSADLRGAPALRPDADASAAPAAPAGTRVQTALERALDLGGAPTAERALVAGVARTLGGADDLRSPRAPGLLDRVALERGDSADLLAFTGWIAPSGSDRSGRLNLARERATKSGDTETAAFAQRRLAEGTASAELIEWALAVLREAPLSQAKDAEARLLRARARQALGLAGLRKSALGDLVALAGEQKSATPIDVWAEIARLAQDEPAVRLRAMRRLAEIRAGARDAFFVRSFAHLGGSALELAAAESLTQQTSAEHLVAIGLDLLSLGRAPWAREALELAARVAPNRADVAQALAVARRAHAASDPARAAAGDAASADLALARARELDPGNPAVRAESAFRASDSPSRTAMADEAHLALPAVFLARARDKPAKRGEHFDRQVHFQRVVTYHADHRISQLIHYAREIVVEPRTENERYEPYIPVEGPESELLFARVHRKDGTVAPPEEQGGGGHRPYVRWAALETGDVVEIALRSWTAGPVGRRGDAPFYFVDYVGSTETHPVLYNEVVVDSPDVSPLAIDVLQGKPDAVTRASRDGRTVQRFVWSDPPTIPDEPLAPKLSEVLPVVVGSTFRSWHDFREWYRAAVSGFTEPDDQVRRIAAELTKGKKTREEKVRALFEFVADEIRYVNYVSGEWWLPNRPQELLARRQGDCDDKAILLITLLATIGVDATEVLVQTRYSGERALLLGDKAIAPAFDHGIAYLPGKGSAPGIWLDATTPQSRMGPLPSMDARALALFVHDGPAKIVETPAGSPDEHGVTASWSLKLDEKGGAELAADERHRGDSAFELRMNLKEPDARPQWVEQQLASGWLPVVEVRPGVDFDGELPRGEARLRYAARTEGFARREGGDLSVPVAETTTLTSKLAPLVTRKLPVVLPPGLAPAHRRHAITLLAPPGFDFADLPPSAVEAEADFGRAEVRFSRVPGQNAMRIDRSVVLDRSTIPPEVYPAWRAWLQRVDRLLHRRVRLVPSSAPARSATARP